MLTIQFTGNLGNKLFQLWSLYGMGKSTGREIFYPCSDIYQYFEGEFPSLDVSGHITKEPTFHFTALPEFPGYDPTQHTILKGYFQSEKYWLPVEKELRKAYTFKKHFLKSVKDKLPGLFKKEVICISIRRGDFINNPTYYQLSAMYYIGALMTHFPNFETQYNLLILSDDIEYCKVHFSCLSNAYFSDGLSAIEQLAAGSLSQYHIISNSTFSWWCAYLAKSKKVIRPKYNFGEAYRQKNPETDFWPDTKGWEVFDHETYKIPLTDATFMIPVSFDHPDRKANLSLSVCMLQRDFDTNIIVMENKGHQFQNFAQWCRYESVRHPYFHRTRMLNQMAMMAETPYIVNWDADVIVPPLQVWASIQVLRKKQADFAYPYDGRFVRVLRRPYFNQVSRALDIGIFGNREFFTNGQVQGKPMATTSVGGAIAMNRSKFIASGMENEFMVSYAPEDAERWDRWHALDYKVIRVNGRLYHLDHWCGADSCSLNPFFNKNHKELDKIRAMKPDELDRYVYSWEWRQRAAQAERDEKKLKNLFAEADKAIQDTKEAFKQLEGNKICTDCGIPYDPAAGHDCALAV